jgi:rod shape-determining protein MreC
MESFFTRYRNFLVLLALLLAQIIGLAVQVRRTEAGRSTLDPRDAAGVRLIRLWADALVTPPELLFHGSRQNAANLWQNYLDLRHVGQQNQDLQKDIDRMRLEQAELLEDAREGTRLEALMGFQQRYVYKTLAAQVIGSSGSDSSRVFYIDKGSADGLTRDMAVMTPDGIVGKVRDVFPHTAQVLAINDPTSGAGVILETTRIRGILRGNAQGRLQVVGILADERIRPGEKVLTAGGDLIFPRGLPAGVVQGVAPDPDRDSFIDVIVKPAAHLDQLDEVLVITSTEPRFPAQQQQDMNTSEALKGAAAEAIEEQEKASQIMAERLPGLTDPNAPAANAKPGQTALPGQNQAGQGQAAPATALVPPVPKLLPTMHSDRFTPAADNPQPSDAQTSGSAVQRAKPASKPQSKPRLPGAAQPASSGRNP